MSISAMQASATQSPSFPSPLRSDLRRHYTLIALAALVVLPAVANAFNVFHNPDYTTATIYGLASISYFAAALSQRLLLPNRSNIALRVRWNLWFGFLLLTAIGLLLAFLDDVGLVHISQTAKHICFSLAYALAYIVTINPPRSTAWRRLWLVDSVIACVMSVMFFLVYLYGEPAGVYASLLFSVGMQVLFALGSFISLRTAESPEARNLARYMMVYFILTSIVFGMANLSFVWPRLSLTWTADFSYAVAAVAVATMPLLMRVGFVKRLTQAPPRSHPLPPAAPVLITAAILMACLPLLHFNLITGIALLVTAVGLFTLKVALMQTDFEHERTSLLQSNKQLRELAYIDPVTGIANRRSFMEAAGSALQVARSGLGTYWLLVFELEDLRSIFANSGRRAGDLYLCEFVKLVRNIFDPSAHFAHIANGEFALLLERANQQTAELTVERVREALHGSDIRLATGAALAASSGPDTVERWLANAGTVLHRNRFVTQTPPPPPG